MMEARLPPVVLVILSILLMAVVKIPSLVMVAVITPLLTRVLLRLIVAARLPLVALIILSILLARL
jgi:hypothetical protein